MFLQQCGSSYVYKLVIKMQVGACVAQLVQIWCEVQVRWGQKPDGVCMVVGSCCRGFDDNTTGD